MKPESAPSPAAPRGVGEKVLTEPPPELRFRRRVRLAPALREVWRSRELIRTLAERQLRARYKQAFLGFGWAILTPLVLMLVFTVFFQPVANVDTGGTPYPLFAYLGILPWTFFSSSVSDGGQSLVQNMPILNKVYCPREVFPMSSIAVAGVDSSIALLVLLGLFIVESFAPSPTSVWVPVIGLVQLTFTLGMTLIVSALLVYLRDLRHMLPIVAPTRTVRNTGGVRHGRDPSAVSDAVLHPQSVGSGHRWLSANGAHGSATELGIAPGGCGDVLGLAHRRVRRLQTARDWVRRCCLRDGHGKQDLEAVPRRPPDACSFGTRSSASGARLRGELAAAGDGRFVTSTSSHSPASR